MPINYARLVATLVALLAGLIQTSEVWPDSRLQQPVEEDEAQLAAVVETLEAENLAKTTSRSRGRGRSSRGGSRYRRSPTRTSRRSWPI